jgi:hypothetical protein
MITATNAVTFSSFGSGSIVGSTVKNAVNGVATAVIRSAGTSGIAVVQTFCSDFLPYAVEIEAKSQAKR